MIAPDLATFLGARLDDDERKLRDLEETAKTPEGYRAVSKVAELGGLMFRQRLADIDAKRRIIAEWQSLRFNASEAAKAADEDLAFVGRHMYAGLEIALKCLALPYADHPDYDERWAP